LLLKPNQNKVSNIPAGYVAALNVQQRMMLSSGKFSLKPWILFVEPIFNNLSPGKKADDAFDNRCQNLHFGSEKYFYAFDILTSELVQNKCFVMEKGHIMEAWVHDDLCFKQMYLNHQEIITAQIQEINSNKTTKKIMYGWFMLSHNHLGPPVWKNLQTTVDKLAAELVPNAVLALIEEYHSDKLIMANYKNHPLICKFREYIGKKCGKKEVTQQEVAKKVLKYLDEEFNAQLTPQDIKLGDDAKKLQLFLLLAEFAHYLNDVNNGPTIQPIK